MGQHRSDSAAHRLDADTRQSVGCGLCFDDRGIPYTPESGTSIGGAIRSATHLLDHIAYRPLRRVIDVSGDGTSLEPGLLAVARDIAVAGGITINGLPICEDGKTAVADYYAAKVIGGLGAFLVVADAFRSFPIAIRRKLALEIAGETGDEMPV